MNNCMHNHFTHAVLSASLLVVALGSDCRAVKTSNIRIRLSTPRPG
jgi:hypothetical protein